MPSHVTPATVRGQVQLPLRFDDGYVTEARVFTFDGLCDGREHVALALGQCATIHTSDPETVPLVRLHSECLTGDVLGSQRCDCGPQLRVAVESISEAGGYLLYLRQEGRGIGLYNKLDAYALQDTGLDTYEANLALGFAEDERDYTVAAQMLLALGVNRLDLLTNNPDKSAQLQEAGIRVTARCRPGCICLRPTAATWRPRRGRATHWESFTDLAGGRARRPPPGPVRPGPLPRALPARAAARRPGR